MMSIAQPDTRALCAATAHHVAARRRTAQTRNPREARANRQLGRYFDAHGNAREVIARRGAAGSTLVIDRDDVSHCDPRLVAHLAADEPVGNAALICERYLADAAGRGRCRRLSAEDIRIPPLYDSPESEVALGRGCAEPPLIDQAGSSYRLELLDTGMSIPELRWSRGRVGTAVVELSAVSTREAIGALESYEPVRALTLHALWLHARGGHVSTTVLRAELARVQESPIVLNRRLRELVLATVERQELSMSEIAIRCGRVKRDRRGNETGETSWLARRLGLLPEGGQSTPTPWIHSDVLGLIARCCIGVSPREVEL